MANFDPDDDDVICIDDEDEIEEVKQKPKNEKRKSESNDRPSKRPRQDEFNPPGPTASRLKFSADNNNSDSSSYGDDSIIEVLEVKPGITGDDAAVASGSGANGEWQCPRCTMQFSADITSCCMCGKGTTGSDGDSDDDDDETNPLKSFAELQSFEEAAASMGGSGGGSRSGGGGGSNSDVWDPPASRISSPTNEPSTSLLAGTDARELTVGEMASALEKLATAADADQHRNMRPVVITRENFWDLGPQFASALRLFIRFLRNREARMFIEPVDNQELLMMGRRPYTSVIKHPLCFRDIASALCDQCRGDGKLPIHSLSCWNMWRGMDLLQAVDLVFLNNLAYNGKEKTKERSQTNKLRRALWEGINGIITSHVGPDIEKRRRCTPTRRGETSGFVIIK